MVNNLHKLCLLLWKNWRLQMKKQKQLFYQIFLPIVWVGVLVFFRSYIPKQKFRAVTFQPFCTFPIASQFGSLLCVEAEGEYGMQNMPDRQYYKTRSLVFSPRNDNLKRTMKVVFGVMFADVIETPNSRLLRDYCEKAKPDEIFAAIEFPDGLQSENELYRRRHFTMSIRFPAELRVTNGKGTTWSTNYLYPAQKSEGPREVNLTTGATPYYYAEGFLVLQHLATIALLAAKSSAGDNIKGWIVKNAIPRISMQRFSYPEYIAHDLATTLEILLYLLLLVGYSYSVGKIINSVAIEKEKQHKEVLKIMGLSNSFHWSAWFIQYFLITSLSSAIVVLLLYIPTQNGAILSHSNPTVILAFLICYNCATITLCFALSVMFTQANVATFVGNLAFMLTALPFLVMYLGDKNNYNPWKKFFSSLLPNTAMGFGINAILSLEKAGAGAKWMDIFEPVQPTDWVSLGHIIVILLVDSIIYMLIALYVEAIFPDDYGVPRPWYFICSKSFWEFKTEDIRDSNDTARVPEGQFFEPEPPNLKPGIKIIGLAKVYHEKTVVKDVTLNMYQNEITVLLGHNGAGKTTTMNLLVGMIPPTSGTAVIDGYDIRTQMERVRRSLGLCPQHDVLFEVLTVEEHLNFSSKLKQLSPKEITQEVNNSPRKLLVDKSATCNETPTMERINNAIEIGSNRFTRISLGLISFP